MSLRWLFSVLACAPAAPHTPVEPAHCDLHELLERPGFDAVVAADADRVVIADQLGLEILVRDTGDIFRSGRWRDGNGVRAAALVGDTLYAASDAWVWAIDVADPLHPATRHQAVGTHGSEALTLQAVADVVVVAGDEVVAFDGGLAEWFRADREPLVDGVPAGCAGADAAWWVTGGWHGWQDDPAVVHLVPLADGEEQLHELGPDLSMLGCLDQGVVLYDWDAHTVVAVEVTPAGGAVALAPVPAPGPQAPQGYGVFGGILASDSGWLDLRDPAVPVALNTGIVSDGAPVGGADGTVWTAILAGGADALEEWRVTAGGGVQPGSRQPLPVPGAVTAIAAAEPGSALLTVTTGFYDEVWVVDLGAGDPTLERIEAPPAWPYDIGGFFTGSWGASMDHVVSANTTDLVVWDARTPGMPELGRITPDDLGWPPILVVGRDLAFLGDQVLSLEDPTDPRQVWVDVELPDAPVTLGESYAMWVQAVQGVWVAPLVDLADQAFLATDGGVVDVAVAGDVGWVLEDVAGARWLTRVSLPTASVVDRIPVDPTVDTVEASDSLVVLRGGATLWTVEPEPLRVMGALTLRADPVAVAVVDDTVLAAGAAALLTTASPGCFTAPP